MHRATRVTHKKNGSCGFLYDCYTCKCTRKEAPRVDKTCFFLPSMTHLSELTHMDIGGASEKVAPAVRNAPHHFCSRVYDDFGAGNT